MIYPQNGKLLSNIEGRKTSQKTKNNPSPKKTQKCIPCDFIHLNSKEYKQIDMTVNKWLFGVRDGAKGEKELPRG